MQRPFDNRFDSLEITAEDIKALLAIAVYTLMLCILPLVLPAQTFRWAFSEAGPFEVLSVPAWLFCAMVIFIRVRPLSRRAHAFAWLCIVFAARETDWHKAFTADSLLKINYYKHANAPFMEKLLAGMVALMAIALLVYVGLAVMRFLFLQGGWRSRSGMWLMVGTVLVIAGKVLDRAPAILAEEYSVVLSPMMDHYAAAFEEGLEMIHPLILAWSVWISQMERRYLS
jgi:hypothetical protein